MEYVLVQPLESLLHTAQRQGQIHADMVLTVKGPAIPPDNTHILAGLEQLVQGLSLLLQPLGTVQEKHIGALGLGDGNALKVLFDVVAGEVHIAGDDILQFLHPFIALRLVSAKQSVHGQHIHGIIVAQSAFLVTTVLEQLVVDDVVAAHQTCQIEGLGGRVQSHGAHGRIFADRLGGDVLVVKGRCTALRLPSPEQAALHTPWHPLTQPLPSLVRWAGCWLPRFLAWYPPVRRHRP